MTFERPRRSTINVDRYTTHQRRSRINVDPYIVHQTTLSIVAICAVALVACSKVSQSAGGATSNAWTVPGVVRLSINSDLNTFDPVISKLYVENYVQEAIFSGLVKYDSKGELIGDLATEVPSLTNGGISPDGRTITYHLRRNAVWQDGVPVTSADVQFTYRLIMDPKVNSPVQSTYAHVTSIDAPGPATVVMHLEKPFAPLLSQVFCNGGFGQIVPRHVLERSADVDRDPFNLHPIGSGPYTLDRWDRGSTIVLRANPRYFGGVAHVKEIDISIISNSDTQLVSAEGHQLDVATQARPSQLPTYRTVAGMRVILAPTYVADYVQFNIAHAPLDDVRVRRALALALDRPRIVATTLVGTAIPAQTLIPPYSWAYDPDNGSPPFDPSAARALLDEAGWHVGASGVRAKDGRTLSFGLLHYDSSTSAAIAQEVERAWRDVGVDPVLRTVPRNVFIGVVSPAGTYDAAVTGAGFDADPDRSQYTETRFIEPHGFNGARYSNAKVDAWTEEALSTYDHADRKRYYALIQRQLNEDLPYIPLDWEQFVYAVNSDLHGFAPETVNSDFWNVQDWSI